MILGAGLDSFAYRSALADQLRIFEVDHPDTQQWKRRRLADAGIEIPPTVAFVQSDFEAAAPATADGGGADGGAADSGAADSGGAEPLAQLLSRHGFDPSRPAFVSWLGVTMYLTRDAVGRTLGVIGGFAAGTEIVVEYMLPEDLRDAGGQAYVQMVTPAAAERGEPWLTFLRPPEMSALLTGHGFEVLDQVGQRASVDGAVWDRSGSLRPFELSQFAHARVRPAGDA